MIASGNWLSSSTMPTARTITPGVPTASPTDAAPWCGVNQERRHPLLAHVSGGVPRWKPLCMPGFPGRRAVSHPPRDLTGWDHGGFGRLEDSVAAAAGEDSPRGPEVCDLVIVGELGGAAVAVDLLLGPADVVADAKDLRRDLIAHSFGSQAECLRLPRNVTQNVSSVIFISSHTP